MKNKKNKGFTLIELLVVISIIGVLAGMGIAGFAPIKVAVNKMKSKDNLKQIYQLIMLYNMDYGTYPTTQSSATRYEKSGGVRDLFPLYDVGIMKKDQLALLKAPGAKLIDFSDDPTIEEFDKNHIGYAYNSTARPDSSEPLLSEQGVSSGKLKPNTTDHGTKPIFEGIVHVLFANGKTEKVPANGRTGKLSNKEVKADQWGLLQD